MAITKALHAARRRLGRSVTARGHHVAPHSHVFVFCFCRGGGYHSYPATDNSGTTITFTSPVAIVYLTSLYTPFSASVIHPVPLHSTGPSTVTRVEHSSTAVPRVFRTKPAPINLVSSSFLTILTIDPVLFLPPPSPSSLSRLLDPSASELAT